MNWDDGRVLLAVHRGGSFLAAGRALRMSASTVMRRISALERTLGRALVQRTTHGVSLEAGALPLVELASGFEQALAAHERERAGIVRLSVPEGFGALAAEAAQRCRAKDPDALVEVSVEARFVDLAGREADIGLRGGRSASKVLIERRVGELETVLVASSAYLAARLPSRRLSREQYAQQDFIGDESVSRGQGPMEWLVARGARRFPFRANASEARLAAARAGLGIVTYVKGVDAPGLEVLALEAPGPSRAFYVVMHRDLRRVPRMRAMAAALEALFTDHTRRRKTGSAPTPRL